MSEQCPLCDQRYRSVGRLREHAWDTHQACHRCGRRFDDLRARHVHWLVAHDETLSEVARQRASSDVGDPSFREVLTTEGPAAAATRTKTGRRGVLTGAAVVVGGTGLWAADVFGGDPSPNSVAGAPVPPAPDERRYAVASMGEPAVTVDYFGSWKCPFCAKFSEGFLATLVDDYVASGDVAIRYRNLSWVDGEPFLGPDAPAAGHAGLAVWHTDPGRYWAYHHQVMANQPPEARRWATPERLATFAEQAGVSDPAAIRAAVKESRYEPAQRATARAAADHAIDGTPTLLVDGTPVSPFKKSKTRRLIEDAIDATG